MEMTPRSSKGKMLIMDDEEGVRAIAERTLRGMGYAVDCAIGGNEAVDLYRRALELGEPYTAVILDLNIPNGMGGRPTLSRLLAIDPAVKAFVCSGYEDDPVMLDPAAHGFSGAIAKPYRFEEMVASFRKVFGDAP